MLTAVQEFLATASVLPLTDICGRIINFRVDIPISGHAGRELQDYISVKAPGGFEALLKRKDCMNWEVSNCKTLV